VDELIRSRMHEALEVEAPPAYLRARVMSSVPAMIRPAQQPPRPFFGLAGHWAAGVVAVLLAIAIIAGLLYTRGAFSPFTPVKSPPRPTMNGLVSPEGVAVGGDGSVYLSDYLGGRIFKVRPDGRVVIVAGGGLTGDGPAIGAWLNHPVGLAIDRHGNLYVADSLGYSVRRVDSRGYISTLHVHDSNGATVDLTGVPMGLAVDASDALWVSELDGTIIRIDASGLGSTLDASSLPAPRWVPGYIALDSAGNLYVSDRAPISAIGPYQAPVGGGCRIVRVTPDRKLSVIAGTGTCGYSGDGGPATKAELNDPNGIAFDSAGDLYFADAYNHRIRRIDRNGIITSVAGTGIIGYSGDGGPAVGAQLAYPFGVAFVPPGLLYFSDGTCACWGPLIPGHLRVLNLASNVIGTAMSGETPVQASG
jgi:sugar lactone lactonase YvrE